MTNMEAIPTYKHDWRIWLLFFLVTTLLGYFTGVPSVYYIAFSFLLVSMVMSMVWFSNSLRQTSFELDGIGVAVTIFLFSLYFVLRLNPLDFSFWVGDATDYLISGVGSVEKGGDFGYFLPLSASVSAVGYSIFGLELAPYSHVLVYSFCIPIFLLIFQHMKISTGVSLLTIFLIISLPLSVWFSKTTFSEPIWQVLILLAIVFSFDIIDKKSPRIVLLCVFALSTYLLLFTRGTAIFLYPLIFFVGIYHYWLHGNTKILIHTFIHLTIFIAIFFILLGIRYDYLVAAQFGNVVDGIKARHLIILFLFIHLISSLMLVLINRYSFHYKKINLNYLIVPIALLVKIVASLFFASRDSSTEFIDVLFLNEASYILGNLGYPFLGIAGLGFIVVLFKSIKGNPFFSILLVYYVLFGIPFGLTAPLDFNSAHELFLYWSRYFFADILVVVVCCIGIGLSVLARELPAIVKSKNVSKFSVLSILVAFVLFNINYNFLHFVSSNSYLQNSSLFLDWVSSTSAGKSLTVLYDDRVRYGPYNAQQLMEKPLEMLGVKVSEFREADLMNLSSEAPVSPADTENHLLLCVSAKRCDIDQSNITAIDSRYFPLEWWQHRPELYNQEPTRMPLFGTIYRFNPEFQLGVKYDVRKDSNVIPLLLASGWYSIEGQFVWSSESSTLSIPYRECISNSCRLELVFTVFSAGADTPKEVLFEVDGELIDSVVINKSGPLVHTLMLPPSLGNNTDLMDIDIEVVGAVSPMDLGVSSDQRVLGIALSSIQLTRTID